MTEIHTQLHCARCGLKFHAMYVNTAALPKVLFQTVKCPHCGKEIKYGYEFNAEFPCNKWWKFWGKRHYITEHSAYNEGTTNEEIYPRHCVCGADILLKQRRIL